MNELDQVKFCVRCGAPLERRFLFGQDRPACPACGWIFFADPKVAAGVLVEQGGGAGQSGGAGNPGGASSTAAPSAILLVRRVNEPGRGLWSFPAGFIDAHEDPARAAERECLEETGLRVAVTGLQNVIAGREHERGADIVLVYRAQILSGDLHPGDDADLAQFFPLDALPPLAFRATRVALGLE